ncbi:phosphoglycerate dehydrogenase [uncultured Sphaerochaeta sp.]|uniref:phosphoglycerate dehydrogenase n=1 Tax=uncultured Sphaerochaeta sp. TaxID=886478 RepID=UPI002A0A12F2|nr:phosphoglycerate dehydrogenase [uncultured Sphaerochaeta sp.]
MSSFRILVTARSFGSSDDKALNLLKEHGCEVIHLKATAERSLQEQLVQHIAQADGIIAGLEEYDSLLLETAKNLKVISRYGVGYDAIDVAYAAKKNIQVTITPGTNGSSVADFAMALMLCAARHVPFLNEHAKRGEFVRPIGMEMYKKTLGVIGTGRIGAGVVKRASGFEMKILCHDIYENEELKKNHNVAYVDFDTLIRESDFISIHTPLTDSTYHLFASEVFDRMKSNAILVNTARGGIIDEEALAEALLDNKLGAAALDETESKTSPLLGIDTCILTPHAGACTREASSNMSLMAVQNLLDVLELGNCEHSV